MRRWSYVDVVTIELPYNMDRSLRLCIETEQQSWVHSPSSGVRRKPLEREKQEDGEVTSVVSFEPGSRFAEHSHPNGEETFVLEGELEDEYGRYPAGTYFRNPPGSVHSPFTTIGCKLFVKLNQFAAGDSIKRAIYTPEQRWLQGNGQLRVMPLHQSGKQSTSLIRWPPGSRFLPHQHWGGEEMFVLEGVFQDDAGDYPAGTWIRNPHQSSHNPFSTEGCLLLVKLGHLFD